MAWERHSWTKSSRHLTGFFSTHPPGTNYHHELGAVELIAFRLVSKGSGRGFANSNDSLLDLCIDFGSVAKLLPVIKLASSNDVVDYGKCPLRVIQVTVPHWFALYSLDLDGSVTIPVRRHQKVLQR